MKRRITRAILAVTALLIIGLGLPLAVVVQRFYQDRAMTELHRRAAETIVEIALPLDPGELAQVSTEVDAPGAFSIYDNRGQRLFGTGPIRADTPVLEAIAGRLASTRNHREMVLASPVTDRSTESIVGAVRVTQPNAVVDHEVLRAWLIIAAVIALALATAAALARAQGHRLAEPVARLAEKASDLGRGDFHSRLDVSGIPEIDVVAAALDDSAKRLAGLLVRERSFSADVSHQLRNPLTGLRLSLEHAARSDQPGVQISAALLEVARLETTVEQLLALARDRYPIGAPLDVEDLLGALAPRWKQRFTDSGRQFRVEQDHRNVAVRASGVSIGQVLDVLIDNSLRHGAGHVTVRSRSAAGGLVFEVSDQGPGISHDSLAAVFERHEGSDHGIGLALALSITEAEGGRLLLATAQPPCFHVILPTID